MTPAEILAAIQLANLAIQGIENAVAQLKANSGLSDDAILDTAAARDAQEHANAQAFLARLNAK